MTDWLYPTEDALLIRVDACLTNPFCLLCDGVPMAMVENAVFYKVSDIINWHENEVQHDPPDVAAARRKAIESLQKWSDEFDKQEGQERLSFSGGNLSHENLKLLGVI